MFNLTDNPIIDTGIHVMEAWLEKTCNEIDLNPEQKKKIFPRRWQESK